MRSEKVVNSEKYFHEIFWFDKVDLLQRYYWAPFEFIPRIRSYFCFFCKEGWPLANIRRRESTCQQNIFLSRWCRIIHRKRDCRAASLWSLASKIGLKVTIQKFDPYQYWSQGRWAYSPGSICHRRWRRDRLGPWSLWTLYWYQFETSDSNVTNRENL